MSEWMSAKVVAEDGPKALPEALPETLPETLVEALPETLPKRLVEVLPEALPKPLVEASPKALPEALPEALPKTLVKALPETLPKPLGEASPKALPEALPKAGPKALPEALGEALPKVWVEHPLDRPPGGQSTILPKFVAHFGFFKRIYVWSLDMRRHSHYTPHHESPQEQRLREIVDAVVTEDAERAAYLAFARELALSLRRQPQAPSHKLSAKTGDSPFVGTGLRKKGTVPRSSLSDPLRDSPHFPARGTVPVFAAQDFSMRTKRVAQKWFERGLHGNLLWRVGEAILGEARMTELE